MFKARLRSDPAGSLHAAYDVWSTPLRAWLQVLTGLLQPENGCMAAALTTLQIFLHLNAAERLRYVHSGSVAELTRLLKTNQMTPGSEAHTLALELLAMLCHDLCSSGQGGACPPTFQRVIALVSATRVCASIDLIVMQH